MTDWDLTWNLESVPDDKLWSEVGRRRASKGYSKPKITKPCIGCGVLLGVAERRGKCPSCGARQLRVTVRKKKRKAKDL